MTTFKPRPCPCGCKKWIMAPWFGCQCSSLSTAEKDELMDMARDAMRYRELRQHRIGIFPTGEACIAEQSSLDAVVDIFIVTRDSEDGVVHMCNCPKHPGLHPPHDDNPYLDPFLGRNHAS